MGGNLNYFESFFFHFGICLFLHLNNQNTYERMSVCMDCIKNPRSVINLKVDCLKIELLILHGDTFWDLILVLVQGTERFWVLFMGGGKDPNLFQLTWLQGCNGGGLSSLNSNSS